MKSAEKKLIETGRKLYRKGLIAATEGNLSYKLSENQILTTRSGVCKGALKPEDLLIVDLEGQTQNSTKHPSTEIEMHLEVYRRRPDVRAIVHAHPPYVISLSLAGISLDKPYLPESVLLLGAVPTAKYGRPSTEQVPASIRPFIEKTDILILDRHGSLTIGKSFTEAFYKLEILENTAKIIWLATQIGSLQGMDKREVSEIMKLRKRVYGLEFPIMPYKK